MTQMPLALAGPKTAQPSGPQLVSRAVGITNEDDTPSDFSNDEDQGDDLVSPIFEIQKASIPLLLPSIVFLYLLTPYLKLRALSIINTQLPLKYGLFSLLGFAALSALVRQLWYMLARYL